jgi:DNA-binding MarR family transcriptional regulator
MINNDTRIDVDIISKLLVTTRSLEKAGDEILSRFGITMGMYEILMLIAHQVDTTTKMANVSQITLASVTHKTKLMEEKGYIRRVVNKRDKRVWRFSLTPRGRDLLEAIGEVYQEVTRPLFAQFAEAEKKQVLSVLTATEEHLRHVLQHRSIMAEYVDRLILERGIDLDR